jgi:hypothetical protein
MRIPLTRVKTAVLAPMPRASVTMAMVVKPGFDESLDRVADAGPVHVPPEREGASGSSARMQPAPDMIAGGTLARPEFRPCRSGILMRVYRRSPRAREGRRDTTAREDRGTSHHDPASSFPQLEKSTLEFLARVITQIPEPRRHLLFYYGHYANVVRGRLGRSPGRTVNGGSIPRGQRVRARENRNAENFAELRITCSGFRSGGVPGARTLVADVLYAARWLRKSPGFTSSPSPLSLWVSDSTPPFHARRRRFSSPASVERPDRLVDVYTSGETATPTPRAPTRLPDFKAQNQVFTDILGYSPRSPP